MLSARFPCSKATHDRVRPHPGHGNPVTRRNGHITGPLEAVLTGTSRAARTAAPAERRGGGEAEDEGWVGPTVRPNLTDYQVPSSA
jgi:hypothetical protein